ncbi:MAG: hypothetical protein RL589_1020 [Actinomycetota bacterium]|jgi:hypothetical protein
MGAINWKVADYFSHQFSFYPRSERGNMKKVMEHAFSAEIALRQKLITMQDSFFARLKDDRGDVPGWVLVVLMTTGLVTAIWTIAAPRLTAILKNSLDSMNGIR